MYLDSLPPFSRSISCVPSTAGSFSEVSGIEVRNRGRNINRESCQFTSSAQFTSALPPEAARA